MGRNGAGKSTLLRHAAGLMEPTRGRVERAGRVALLLQNPGDYLIHERVAEEAPPAALAAVGLAAMAERNPKDLSGGERQRLALAIVTGGEGEDGGAGASPAVLALDEPTRGMDRGAKAELARDLRRRAGEGQAVIVATHDPEFAAACATRAVLLADGRVIADGPAADLLAGGWYFATETARILGGAGGALLPEQGAELLAARAAAPAVPHAGAEATIPDPPTVDQAKIASGASRELAARLVPRRRRRARDRLARLRAPPALRADGRGRGHARGRRRARPRRVRRAAGRQADHRDDVRRRLRARPAAGFHRRRGRDADVELPARPGPLHPLADGGLGLRRPVRRARRPAQPAAPGPRAARALLRVRRARGEGGDERLHVHDRRQPHPRRVPRRRRRGPAVRHDRHGRELPLRPRLRPRARAAARADARADGDQVGADPRACAPGGSPNSALLRQHGRTRISRRRSTPSCPS